MSKYFYFLLIGSVAFFGCRTKPIKDCVVIIKPVGPEDLPRTTFIISLKKTNFKKENPFADEILTDENSLRNVVLFIEDHRPTVKDTINKVGWGALEISTYNANRLMIDFKLNNAEHSGNYLALLIESLKRNHCDAKLIKALTEDGLAVD